MYSNVVRIVCKSTSGYETKGTGVLIDRYVMTVDHVVKNCKVGDALSVQYNGEIHDATVHYRGFDETPKLDFAVLITEITTASFVRVEFDPSRLATIRFKGYPCVVNEKRLTYPKGREFHGTVESSDFVGASKDGSYPYEGRYLGLNINQDVEQGTSGAPVFLEPDNELIGFVVTIMDQNKKQIYILPIASIINADNGKWKKFFSYPPSAIPDAVSSTAWAVRRLPHDSGDWRHSLQFPHDDKSVQWGMLFSLMPDAFTVFIAACQRINIADYLNWLQQTSVHSLLPAQRVHHVPRIWKDFEADSFTPTIDAEVSMGYIVYIRADHPQGVVAVMENVRAKREEYAAHAAMVVCLYGNSPEHVLQAACTALNEVPINSSEFFTLVWPTDVRRPETDMQAEATVCVKSLKDLCDLNSIRKEKGTQHLLNEGRIASPNDTARRLVQEINSLEYFDSECEFLADVRLWVSDLWHPLLREYGKHRSPMQLTACLRVAVPLRNDLDVLVRAILDSEDDVERLLDRHGQMFAVERLDASEKERFLLALWRQRNTLEHIAAFCLRHSAQPLQAVFRIECGYLSDTMDEMEIDSTIALHSLHDLTPQLARALVQNMSELPHLEVEPSAIIDTLTFWTTLLSLPPNSDHFAIALRDFCAEDKGVVARYIFAQDPSKLPTSRTALNNLYQDVRRRIHPYVTEKKKRRKRVFS